VNDQRLAPHRFHEPSGLEHSDILLLKRCQFCTAEMGGQIIEQHAVGYEQRAKYKVHENIGCKIEDGAGWPNPDHKTSNTGSIPFTWFGDELLIHIVPWNCRAGQVINQVQENQVHAHHRQEAQKPPVPRTYCRSWMMRSF